MKRTLRRNQKNTPVAARSPRYEGRRNTARPAHKKRRR